MKEYHSLIISLQKETYKPTFATSLLYYTPRPYTHQYFEMERILKTHNLPCFSFPLKHKEMTSVSKETRLFLQRLRKTARGDKEQLQLILLLTDSLEEVLHFAVYYEAFVPFLPSVTKTWRGGSPGPENICHWSLMNSRETDNKLPSPKI